MAFEPKKQAELDQMLSGVCDILPPLWWALYKQCLEQGFTEQQALKLVQAYIYSTLRGGQ